MDPEFQLKSSSKYFENRQDAGSKLAKLLKPYVKADPIILGIPRGGVVVAYEIAKKFGVLMDVIISRKIGAPFDPEFGVGAISEEGTEFLDQDSLSSNNLTRENLKTTITKEREELKRRIILYRHGKSLRYLNNKTVILVDDGLATGVTAKVTLNCLHSFKPSKIIFALPVCAENSKKSFEKEVDKLICLYTPKNLQSIGEFYNNFNQVTDKEVIDLLKKTKVK